MEYFQTIESILKLTRVLRNGSALSLFPDYCVYFKTKGNTIQLLPVKRFQTIESILKLLLLLLRCLMHQNFQTIESILKHCILAPAGLHLSYFQTIESILKHGIPKQGKQAVELFPDY